MRTVFVFFSSATNTGSFIFIEPGTVRFAVVSPPRSYISRYAPDLFRFAYQGFRLNFFMLPSEL